MVRVSGKDRDTLQQAIALLKGKDFGIDMQFTNYRERTDGPSHRDPCSSGTRGQNWRRSWKNRSRCTGGSRCGLPSASAVWRHDAQQGGLPAGPRLANKGCVVLRFNYRGVNLSEGEYADESARPKMPESRFGSCRRRYPDLPVLAAGFSFGSRVALRLASQEPLIKRVIAVGFPTRMAKRDFVYQVNGPKYFIQSTHDQFGPKPDLESFYATLAEPKKLHWVPASDHFFVDALDQFEQVVEQVALERDAVHDWRS